MTMLLDLLCLLFRDRLAQRIRFRRCITREFNGRSHQLFLIDRDSIGILEDRLQLGMAIFHFRFSAHTCDVIGDECHRPRAIQRDHRDDIIEGLRFHLHEPTGHAAAFHLEDASRLSAAHQFKRLWIIERDVVQIIFDAVPLLDHFTGTCHHR